MTTMYIPGIVRPRNLGLILSSTFLLGAVACSTDFEYLRAGNNASGAGGDDQTGAGAGGSAGAAGSSDDGGASADSSVADRSEDAHDAAEAAPEPHDTGPRRAPTSIVTGVSYPTMQLSPSPGGTNFTDTCPQDKVAVGFNGSVDQTATNPHSIQLLCGALSVGGTGPFQVTTSPAAALPVRGTPGPTAQNRTCPVNQVVIGFDVRAGMFIDQLTFRCAPFVIGGGPDTYTLSLGAVTSIDPIGGTGGVIFPQVNCMPGGVAVGSVVRAGTAIDAFGLACAPPSLVLTP